MTSNKYIAFVSENEKVLKGPVMRKPERKDFDYRDLSYLNDYVHEDEYNAAVDKYNEHLKNLLTIPAEWLKDSYNGKIFVEGVDFKINRVESCPYNCTDGEPDCSRKYGICTPVNIAVPIDKQPDKKEDGGIRLDVCYSGNLNEEEVVIKIFNALQGGIISIGPIPNDYSVQPDKQEGKPEKNLWELLTRYVCARDMQGLNYYKDDLLNGLNEIMGIKNNESYESLIKKGQGELMNLAIDQNNQQQ